MATLGVREGKAMRADMDRLLVERPRWGSRFKARRKGYKRALNRVSIDEAPSRESIYRLRGQTRSLNDYLSPLRRYLLKQVGRPWNDVYREICEHIRFDSTVQQHVRQHLWQFIERHVLLIDGVACYSTGYFRTGKPIECDRDNGFDVGLYVCPESGLLKRGRRRKRVDAPRLPKRLISLSKDEHYFQAEGIWYAVTLVPLATAAAEAFDVNLKRPAVEVTPAIAVAEYGRPVIAIKRRQISGRQIRRLSLAHRSVTSSA